MDRTKELMVDGYDKPYTKNNYDTQCVFNVQAFYLIKIPVLIAEA